MWFFACLLDHAYAPPYVCILLDSYNIPLQIVLQLHAYVLSAMQPPPRKPSPRLFSLGARRNPLSGALICDISHTMSVQQAARPSAAIPARIHSTPIVFGTAAIGVLLRPIEVVQSPASAQSFPSLVLLLLVAAVSIATIGPTEMESFLARSTLGQSNIRYLNRSCAATAFAQS